MSKTVHAIQIDDALAGQTVAAILRKLDEQLSWSQAKRRVMRGFVRITGEVCRDPARRLTAGEVVEVFDQPERLAEEQIDVPFLHLDRNLVVVEKPPGIPTVRHPAERHWPEKRRALSPTLDDLVQGKLAEMEGTVRSRLPRLRVVHRLDKHTSGLLVFARTVEAERGLGEQFKRHSVRRRYLAVAKGKVKPQTVRSNLVRDRGDGRRGSTAAPGVGKPAVTHIDVIEHLDGYTLVSCRLETGRTHQIRIHLSELGHPVCGDPVYHRKRDGEPIPDESNAPRLALHACELGFDHPSTGEPLLWSSALPDDLARWLARLKA